MRSMGSLVVALLLTACTTKQDVIATPPILDRLYPGDYLEAATCTHHGIQTADYTIHPDVDFIPGRGWAEVQTSATGAFTGKAYAQVSRFEDLGNGTFRVITRAPWRADGAVAIEAIKNCTTPD